jgi:hypothetical protein
MRGIRDIRITGIIFSDSILIGADTELVSIMTRIFIISTIVARVAVGNKASMGLVLPEPQVLAAIPLEPPALVVALLEHPPLGLLAPEQLVLVFVLMEPLDLGNIPESLVLANTPQPLLLGNLLEPLVMGNLPEPLDRGNIPEPLVKGNIPKPLVMAARNLKKPDMMRKKSSKGNQCAFSEIR